ncbi:MAG: hypothetical protein ABSH20_28940, partial [Tepidisphaeraceae bacterium]
MSDSLNQPPAAPESSKPTEPVLNPLQTPQPEVAPPEPALSQSSRPARWRHLLWVGLAVASLVAVALFAFVLFLNTSACERLIRNRLVAFLQTSTGARVEIGSFHWHPIDLEVEVNGLALHGLETASEAPYLRVEHLAARFSLRQIWSQGIQLRDCTVSQPSLHLIVYRDGSTNQPHPRKPRKAGKPALDTLFDLKADHLSLSQGLLNYENRAAAFDFQNRYAPLNLDASDVSLLASYLPTSTAAPESYRIQMGARDLNLQRPKAEKKPVQGFLQATVDLTRSAAYLRSLRITARAHGVSDRSLEISGSLTNFAAPQWQGRAEGDLDMRLLDSLTGYPFAPQGLAHLNLAGAGHAGLFRIDGAVHVVDGSYIGTGVVATGIGLDANIHADPELLLITSIVARLRQGGQLEGNLTLAHWLPPISGADTLQPSTPVASKNHRKLPSPAQQPPPPAKLPADIIEIPVDGTINARFNNVALDTLMEMVVLPPFQRLGFDTRLNGPATAIWVRGDVNTLSVSSLLNLTAPNQIAPA